MQVTIHFSNGIEARKLSGQGMAIMLEISIKVNIVAPYSPSNLSPTNPLGRLLHHYLNPVGAH